MKFRKHSNLEGQHALFSPSQSSWLRYSDDKILDVFDSKKASDRGTILHAWAKSTIDLGIRQRRSDQTLCAYVNDAIGFDMDTEVVLYYSDYFFGTADAICFRNNMLRIHDLKTGKTPAKMEQLVVYAALFCLEYKIKPSEIQIELRIYQNDEVLYHKPEAEEIVHTMDRIVHLNNILNKSNEKED